MQTTIPTTRVPLEEHKQGEVYSNPDIAFATEEGTRLFYIESYGCQMNFNDSEIVASILGEAGFQSTRDADQADLILINTCSIREKAEETVHCSIWVLVEFCILSKIVYK